MRKWFSRTMVAAGIVVVFSLASLPTAGQVSASRIPRALDGKPNLTGLWQAINSANWDVQDHAARQGPVIALGAAFSVPEGAGVVEGNEIPYRPEALAQKKENFSKAMTLDPEVKCFCRGCRARRICLIHFRSFRAQRPS
jgi:hypothetical protein